MTSAERCVTLSWSRLDGRAGRPRVPSFYALEVVRASQGLLPSFERLAEEADKLGGARLAWPAPEDPADAIDAAEHDLSLFARVRRRTESHGERCATSARTNLARACGFVPDAGTAADRSAGWWSLEQGLRAIQASTRRSYSPTPARYARCPYSPLRSSG